MILPPIRQLIRMWLGFIKQSPPVPQRPGTCLPALLRPQQLGAHSQLFVFNNRCIKQTFFSWTLVRRQHYL
ncbi:hypothetical protein N9C98_00285 [Synechococcus sp. AH-224-G16]|nr:hypothetical protein [Synechococcus sp. AH-224-G16]